MQHSFYHQLIHFQRPFIIAEIGANHNGDMDLAKQLIRSAAACGADAVKFQSWSKVSLFTRGFYEEHSQFVDKKFGNLEDMVKKFSLSEENHLDLKNYCDQNSVTFCSSAFCAAEVDLLEKLNVPFFKVASMDLNNIYFLKYIAEKGFPIFLSTGMGSLSEIDRALNTIYKAGNDQVVLLHCVSIYPPRNDIVNLRNILMLKETLGKPVGFSDHTLGTSIPLAAISLGAKVIEKHFTLDKNFPGWDHAVSADPEELKYLVEEGKKIIEALGNYQRILSKDEQEQRKSFRRSIVAKRNLRKGKILTIEDIDFKRPGTGIAPDEMNYVVGRVTNRDVAEDDQILWRDLT